MKDIIITAGGKNVTPSEWENELKFSPYITDAVVIGDKRPYLVCIVMIDQENVEKFAQDHDVPFSNYASLTRARGARADPGRARQGQQEVRPRRAGQEVLAAGAAAHRRGRGTDPDDEAQAQARAAEVRTSDRRMYKPGPRSRPSARYLPTRGAPDHEDILQPLAAAALLALAQPAGARAAGREQDRDRHRLDPGPVRPDRRLRQAGPPGHDACASTRSTSKAASTAASSS
jgi:hypothetical protein